MEAHPRLRFVRGDITKSTFPNSFFDCVVANSVLEHIGLDSPDYRDPSHLDGDFMAIREIKRILKTDGTLILTLPFGAQHKTTLHGGVKLRIYNEGRLKRLVEGFEVIRADLFWREGFRWQRSKNLPSREANVRDTDFIVCMTLRQNVQESQEGQILSPSTSK
jgi:SAM-dependent methyltransferase